MKIADTTLIKVGKIGTTYGVKGWLKIHSYTEYGASILNYQPWYLSSGHDEWQLCELEDGHTQGDRILAKLKDVESPEVARQYTDKIIAIARAQLPQLKQNEYYWSDLIGLKVINTHGTHLGDVIYLIETGSNDVLVIKNDKEHAIPYLPGNVVLNVDLTKREMLVDWELI